METVNLIERHSMPQPLGEIRGLASRLDQIEATIAAMPEAPECRTTMALCRLLGETAFWLVETVGSNAGKRFNGFAGSLSAELQAYERSAIAPNERRTQQKQAIQRTRDEVVKRVTESFGGEGQRRAAGVVAARTEAYNEYERALAAARGPLSLSGTLDIQVAVRVAALKEEMAPQAPAFFTSLLKSIINRGDAERERIAMLALVPLANAVASGSPPTLAKNYGPQDASTIRNLRTQAAEFLAFVNARREELVPAHLHTLKAVLAFIDSVFWWLCGFSPTWMNPQEFSRFFERADRYPSPDAVHPEWIARYARSVLPEVRL